MTATRDRRPGVWRGACALALSLALVLGLALGLGLMTSGCAAGTYLQLNVTGAGLPEIHSMSVTLTLTPASGGPVVRSQGPIGSDGGVIRLPASLAFKLNDESGTLQVSAVAYDGAGKPIATATGSTTIMHGQTWTVGLNLAPS